MWPRGSRLVHLLPVLLVRMEGVSWVIGHDLLLVMAELENVGWVGVRQLLLEVSSVLEGSDVLLFLEGVLEGGGQFSGRHLVFVMSAW